MGKKYQIIYADPPWSIGNPVPPKRLGKEVKDHYGVMTPEVIKSLPVQNIAEDNCMLFIWVTFPNLPLGLEVINSWGFKYKTLGFSWIKTNPKNGKLFFGIGYYTKSNCEVCLIGVKGKAIKASDSVSSALIAPRGSHSSKPNEVRDRIVQFVGDVPRIELFARTKTPGWDVWGNEVESDIDLLAPHNDEKK
jgi:N6-adenosine-specific RNA methylase IME4